MKKKGSQTSKDKKTQGSPFHVIAKKSAEILGNIWAFFIALLLIIIWLVCGPFFNFSDTWQLIINTGTSVITFLMVFLIQRTQNRDSEGIQLKLDELIRANELAHNSVIDLDTLSDEQIKKLEQTYKKMGGGNPIKAVKKNKKD